jgi:hypothetical protein
MREKTAFQPRLAKFCSPNQRIRASNFARHLHRARDEIRDSPARHYAKFARPSFCIFSLELDNGACICYLKSGACARWRPVHGHSVQLRSVTVTTKHLSCTCTWLSKCAARGADSIGAKREFGESWRDCCINLRCQLLGTLLACHVLGHAPSGPQIIRQSLLSGSRNMRS